MHENAMSVVDQYLLDYRRDQDRSILALTLQPRPEGLVGHGHVDSETLDTTRNPRSSSGMLPAEGIRSTRPLKTSARLEI